MAVFMDGIQLPQRYRATKRRQFTFSPLVSRNSWYSFNRPWKDERSTSEPPSGFEHETTGLGIQRLNC